MQNSSETLANIKTAPTLKKMKKERESEKKTMRMAFSFNFSTRIFFHLIFPTLVIELHHLHFYVITSLDTLS